MSSATTAAEIKRLLEEADDDRSDVVRLDELRKIFARLIHSGEFDTYNPGAPETSTSTGQQDAKISAVQKKWKQFLSQSHKSFVHQLAAKIRRGNQLYIRPLVRTYWGVVASAPRRTQPQGVPIVSADLLLQFVQALTGAAPTLTLDKGLTNLLTEIVQHHDVQYYLLTAIASHAETIHQRRKLSDTDARHAQHQLLFDFLCLVPIVTSKDELEEGSYLFPPPDGVTLEEANVSDDSSEEEDDDSDDDDEEDGSDTDDEQLKSGVSEPPSKKPKIESSRKYAFQTLRGHRRGLSKAWHAVLRLSLPERCLKQALLFLPNHILPNVSRPLLFSDFFMSAYQHGGVISVLALDGLFLLMTQHRLEYPSFYKQLYRTLTPQLFFVKYRTRFFRLLDKCLKNDLLPAHIVAAFLKRLCRCTMTAPPSAILFVLALCSNLIRKFPETACLIHRKEMTDKSNDPAFADEFDPAIDDPEKANALSSSLWELQTLERHYSQQVVTLARSLGRTEELSSPLYNLEDFLGHTYATLMEQERKPRKQRSKFAGDASAGTHSTPVTPLTFVEPRGLIVEGDVFSGILETC
jgi:U3 small nucleolar RNA-associated protein 19